MLHFYPETGIIKLYDVGTGRDQNGNSGPLCEIQSCDAENHHGKEDFLMQRAEIVSQILAILEDVAEISPEDVSEDSVLMDDLDLSSMEILTIVADLEETFGLRIPEKELRNFVTIADVADYLADNAG